MASGSVVACTPIAPGLSALYIVSSLFFLLLQRGHTSIPRSQICLERRLVVDQGRCKGGCLERLDVCAVIITEGVTLVASGKNDFLFLNKDEESEEEIANVR